MYCEHCLKRNSITVQDTTVRVLIEPYALTVPQAAIYSGFTEGRIRREIKEERLGHRRDGRTILVLRPELEQWLNRLPGHSPDPAGLTPTSRRLLEQRWYGGKH